jgi:serine-type D-Ala-D-Ala carboxypeptidase (penicillin-binding protein 5/6)
MNLLRRDFPPSIALTLLAACAVGSLAGAKEPADNLKGPPFVTAQAWAIADGRTGELLWGMDEDVPAKAASTTKIMCAWVVLQLAHEDPAVLDEEVIFSELAANTSGSSARLREGERIRVAELLYGLMLPSGNDAGNALAEHFNDRLATAEADAGDASPSTRSNFIAEMNRQAKALGMNDTIYRSPFGDGGTPDDRTTTPRDLLRLAWHAMHDERFREIVATHRYDTTVRTPDGGTRDVSWTNTNALLQAENFDGVKTGTTSLAGSCLVSSGRRDGDRRRSSAPRARAARRSTGLPPRWRSRRFRHRRHASASPSDEPAPRSRQAAP